MYGYIYKITCTNENSSIFNHFYIGQHKIGKHDHDCRQYICSGKLIKRYLEKHFSHKSSYTSKPLSDFKLDKEILCFCESSKELNEKEIYYISQHHNNKNCLNLTKGGEGACELPPDIEKKRLKNLRIARSSMESRSKTGEASKKLWEDEVYRLKHSYDNFSEEKKEEIRSKKIEWLSKPENRKLISERTKAAMNRDDVKNKMKQIMSTDEYKRNHSEASKRVYENNKHLKKQIGDSVSKSWKSMSPEEYRKRCEAIKLGMKRKLQCIKDQTDNQEETQQTQ